MRYGRRNLHLNTGFKPRRSLVVLTQNFDIFRVERIGTNTAKSALDPSDLEYETFGTNDLRQRSVDWAPLVQNISFNRK
jgi:hypothetical protein